MSIFSNPLFITLLRSLKYNRKFEGLPDPSTEQRVACFIGSIPTDDAIAIHISMARAIAATGKVKQLYASTNSFFYSILTNAQPALNRPPTTTRHRFLFSPTNHASSTFSLCVIQHRKTGQLSNPITDWNLVRSCQVAFSPWLEDLASGASPFSAAICISAVFSRYFSSFRRVPSWSDKRWFISRGTWEVAFQEVPLDYGADDEWFTICQLCTDAEGSYVWSETWWTCWRVGFWN